MKDLLQQLNLCLITNITNQDFSEYIEFIKQTIHGGVTMVQLREKSIDYIEIKNRALVLQAFLRPLNIPLIINDFVDLAVEINADGVHLGNSDASALEAREKLGPSKIIGVSIESLEDLEKANKLPISYVAASAVFPSSSKLNCKKFWGIEGLRKIVKKSLHPVMAIGGISASNKSAIFDTGVKGIAVISAIHNAPDPYQAARSLLI